MAERCCGNCVHWNGPIEQPKADTDRGDCPFFVEGAARSDQCVRWFSTDQLHAPLYGRKQRELEL